MSSDATIGVMNIASCVIFELLMYPLTCVTSIPPAMSRRVSLPVFIACCCSVFMVCMIMLAAIPATSIMAMKTIREPTPMEAFVLRCNLVERFVFLPFFLFSTIWFSW